MGSLGGATRGPRRSSLIRPTPAAPRPDIQFSSKKGQNRLNHLHAARRISTARRYFLVCSTEDDGGRCRARLSAINLPFAQLVAQRSRCAMRRASGIQRHPCVTITSTAVPVRIGSLESPNFSQLFFGCHVMVTCVNPRKRCSLSCQGACCSAASRRTSWGTSRVMETSQMVSREATMRPHCHLSHGTKMISLRF